MKSEERIDALNVEYLKCLYTYESGNKEPLDTFRKEHPIEYPLINGMYHKRQIVRRNIQCMVDTSKKDVYFGALTFDNEHDKSEIVNKRKQAIRFLNEMFSLWMCVEEYGEKHGRYHVHYIGVFRFDKGFEDFIHGWHSRQDIQRIGYDKPLNEISKDVKKVARYLCNYVVKEVPRLRRNKTLVKVFKTWQKSCKWRDYGFKCFAEEKIQEASNEIEIASVFDL